MDGFVLSDTFITEPTCGVNGDHSAPGTYPIVCTGGDAGSNYSIQYVNGILTINAAQEPQFFLFLPLILR
jgi:hypothetical protein